MGTDVEIGHSAVVDDRIFVTGSRFDEGLNAYLPAIWWQGGDLVWRLAETPPLPEGTDLEDTDLRGIVAGGPGLVAVGRACCTYRNLLWLSPDGETWEAVTDPSLAKYLFAAVAAANDGLILSAVDTEANKLVALVSSDGRTWRPADGEYTHQAVLLGDSWLAGSGERLTAFESDGRVVRVWRARGADDWRLVGELPESHGVSTMLGAVGPAGWVAVGARAGRPVAWASVDGIDWQRAHSAPGFLEAIVADRAGFIGVGYYDPGGGCAGDPTKWHNLTWTSSDGRTWRLMHDMGDGARIEALRRRGRTLIGIGTIAELQGAVWTARLPDASSDEGPVPTPFTYDEPGGCGP